MQELSQAVTAMARTLDRQETLRHRLTGDVAHELRTPLTNIASHLEMMCEGIWEPTPERLSGCYEEIQRISGLVDDMEKLHRIDADQLVLHKSTFAVRPLIENAAAMFERELEEKAITLEIDCAEVFINADRDRIAQVVTNLLSNAVKYTETGGSICISARNGDDAFRMTVSDTGVAFPLRICRIFLNGFTVQTNRETAAPAVPAWGLQL